MSDVYAIVCNVTTAGSYVRAGAKAYVLQVGDDRVKLQLRSRGGRWITLWWAKTRIHNVRLQTMPPDHPMRDEVYGYPAKEDAQREISKLTNGASSV